MAFIVGWGREEQSIPGGSRTAPTGSEVRVGRGASGCARVGWLLSGDGDRRNQYRAVHKPPYKTIFMG
ncbi:MAG: hypothetical protein HXX08_22350 [Chloroflexi bacterium]|uniref:Uncharacterized protein n=1 Tax=Candidatus Chlorohelix allophototropha TaxID=3003348 RepID=A0A8T7M909_9CHLR|nr:hypothetical protein [Chloroflexota bacterium]WJW68540.1 hypothetical protein OZ401_004154 [Chloroflexota bacterium L227-S17]